MSHYLPLVELLAAKQFARLPLGSGLEVGDLVATGMFGLADAVGKFDPGRNTRFTTYAPRRIHGAIVDWLREVDWAPRLARSRARRYAAADQQLRAELGHEPTRDELGDRLGVSAGELERFERDADVPDLVSLSSRVTGSGFGARPDTPVADVLADPAAPRAAAGVDRREAVRRVTRGLGRREALTVELYWFAGMNMAEVGRVIGVSKSMVSLLTTSILARLRASFAYEELAALLLPAGREGPGAFGSGVIAAERER